MRVVVVVVGVAVAVLLLVGRAVDAAAGIRRDGEVVHAARGSAAVCAVHDCEGTELLALKGVALLGHGDEQKLDGILRAIERGRGGRLVHVVGQLDDDVQRLVEHVLPPGLAAHLGLLVLADRALAANHDLAAGVAL